ncbi:MarR family winged helix-turn-helix transcriptional regulator [Salinibacillus xinjiangensis]|uniref:MarR family transcriptional regulator n=1 Tax=Salinibacillus xinjiangensis TaxID=1229268 RepID=A0A6G1XBT6_9BACI|nr:MarR family transcriptional regulator [Salinibacillus xinjiangensis]MRG88340.1 MarR family transcriptional regulator [Salinibacillus xinjiangensis]
MNSKKNEQELSLKLFVVLNRAVQSIESHAIQDIKSHGLNLTEFSVLELLFHKGEQPIQKIGQKVLLASSSITYVVDKLEKKNYIRRRACPSDRRVTYAGITEEGKQLMEEIFPKHSEAMNDIMGGLTAEEKEHLIEQIKKLGLYAQSL